MADVRTLSLALLAAVALPAAAAKLPAGVIAVPLSRDTGLSAYYAEFQVGTPPQKTYLKVDTGSPNYAFLDPRNPVCATQDCKTFGTFDNTTSSYVCPLLLVSWSRSQWLIANAGRVTMRGPVSSTPCPTWAMAII